MILVSRRINVSAGYMQINLSTAGWWCQLFGAWMERDSQLIAITSHNRNGPWEGTIMIRHHGQVSSGQWESQDITRDKPENVPLVLKVYWVGVGLLTT